jgi:hypothetical protein
MPFVQACGRHPGHALMIGAIVGISEVPITSDAPPERVLAWHDLAEPVAFTYSRSRGKANLDFSRGLRVGV